MADIGEYAVAFIVLFLIGGFLGMLSLPEFVGRFWLSGFLFAVFGTGSGILIIKKYL